MGACEGGTDIALGCSDATDRFLRSLDALARGRRASIPFRTNGLHNIYQPGTTGSRVVYMQRRTGAPKVRSALIVLLLVATSVFPGVVSSEGDGGVTDPPGQGAGTGTSSEPVPLYTMVSGPEDSNGFGSYLANVDDVQGDGVQDIIVGSGFGGIRPDKPNDPGQIDLKMGSNYLMYGRTDRTFDPAQLKELENMSSYWSFREQRWLGDVNGDGYADVVSSPNEYYAYLMPPYIYTPSVQVRYGSASGLPEDPDLVIMVQPPDVPANMSYVSFSYGGVGDVNGDGFNDLLVYRYAFDIWPIEPPINRSGDGSNSGGSGGKDDTEPVPDPKPYPTSYPADLQLFYGSKLGLPSEPSWNASIKEDLVNRRWSVEVHHADVNGDGCEDVILTSYSAPHVTLHLGSSEGLSVEPDMSITFNLEFSYGWKLHAPVDSNGDAYDDFIIDYGATEGLFKYVQYIYVFRGSSRGVSEQPSATYKLDSHESALVGTSDFNGDGLDDVLLAWQTATDGKEGAIDITLHVHFSAGGEFRPTASWGYTIHGIEMASSVTGFEPGDYDGDGFGDVAFGVPGQYYWDASGQMYTNPGHVVILWGAGIMDLLKPISLIGGPRLFAGYTAYDFRVNANPTGVSELPTMVELTLDPEGANVLIACDIVNLPHFTKVRDPNNHVRVASSDVTDVVSDRENNTVWVHFRVLFEWNWPHEDLCDVLVSSFLRPGTTAPYRAKDLFWVENDLDFRGQLSARGEWQGARHEGEWVRSGERVTIAGPVVVYENTTDVFPPSGTCTVVLQDDDGDFASTALSSGAPANLTIAADAATDADENYTLSLGDLPGNATLVSRPRIHLPVDGDMPLFRNAVPEETEWFSSHEVLVSITADDGMGSGVRSSTMEYSYSTTGLAGFGPWTREGLQATSDGQSADGLVLLEFPDGTENFVRWRAGDIVGNGPGESLPYRILVDTKNVTFTDAVPDPDAWQTRLPVECGVTITDTEGSGIEVITVQFRVSFQNLSHYGPWTDWERGSAQDAQSITVRQTLALAESGFNYVQWRAKDIAGNGFTASPHYRVRVDTTPIEFYAFAPGPTAWQNTSRVTCTVNVSDRLGGSGVDLGTIKYRYRTGGGDYTGWTPVGMSGVKQDTWFTLALDLADGADSMVQLSGLDVAGNGPTPSAEHRLQVDTKGPIFVSIGPGADQKQPATQVTVTLMLKDSTAGLNASRVWYRSSTVSESDMRTKAWSLMPVEMLDLVTDQPVYGGSVALELVRGKTNFVQFRAQDRLFNANESQVSTIWVNQLPLATLADPKPGLEFKEEERVLLNATGSSDPDGDDLNYTWYAENVTEPLGYGRTLLTKLPVGVYNVTLVVRDTDGAEANASVKVTVVKLPPPKTQSTSDAALLVLLLIAILVASMAAGYYASRRKHQ